MSPVRKLGILTRDHVTALNIRKGREARHNISFHEKYLSGDQIPSRRRRLCRQGSKSSTVSESHVPQWNRGACIAKAQSKEVQTAVIL